MDYYLSSPIRGLFGIVVMGGMLVCVLFLIPLANLDWLLGDASSVPHRDLKGDNIQTVFLTIGLAFHVNWHWNPCNGFASRPG